MKNYFNLGLFPFFLCDTPCPQEKFTCLKRFIWKSRPTSILSQSLFEAFAGTVCVLHLIYVALQHSHCTEENIECKLKKSDFTKRKSDLIKKEIRFDKKGNQVSQKRKSDLAKKEIRFDKKGNQVWQKGSTGFSSGAQVAENELACLFDREHFSEKTSYNVRPSISCRRMLSFLILANPCNPLGLGT